jgi:dTDP-4-dehydrorhamnose reductase
MTTPRARGDAAATAPLEMWGGLECTINRVRGTYHRQLERNGHLGRAGDVERFAGLGIRAIRYPVLWEQHAPDGEDVRGTVDWRWADERLLRLRALGVRPIVGLTHHGSGPRATSLVDPAFPDGLARYAAQVAARYPWVDDWTPVNEPLTTARFSALYGVWYPHARDVRAFARAIVGQCRAVQLSMRAIRAVNPHARLVQTDDLGRIHSTPALAREAELQNERRWLGFDLLLRRVDREHTDVVADAALGSASTTRTRSSRRLPAGPDIGINHYLHERPLPRRARATATRRRCRSSRTGQVARRRGLVFRHVEAVRACPECSWAWGRGWREAWTRYGRPLASTECHPRAPRATSSCAGSSRRGARRRCSAARAWTCAP